MIDETNCVREGSHVGIFGWGKDETQAASDRTAGQVQEVAKHGSGGSALERARGADEGGLSGAATRFLERVLDVGIDGKGPFDSAHTVADQALKDAGGDPDEAIRILHRQHRRLGLAGGFVTGFGGFFTMAVALPANVLEFYLLGTRMTAHFEGRDETVVAMTWRHVDVRHEQVGAMGQALAQQIVRVPATGRALYPRFTPT